MLERVKLAWDTLRNKPQSQLLLSGPLPTWMQETFECEAKRLHVPVGHVIFETLRLEALHLRSRKE